MKRLQVYISEQQYAKVRHLAYAEFVSISHIIRWCIDAYLNKSQREIQQEDRKEFLDSIQKKLDLEKQKNKILILRIPELVELQKFFYFPQPVKSHIVTSPYARRTYFLMQIVLCLYNSDF